MPPADGRSASCGVCGTPLPPGSSTCAACVTDAGEIATVPPGPPGPPSRMSGAAGPPGTFGPGQRLGARYTVIKLLGRGGMGAVYQAWDDELELPVAIKTILPEASGSASDRQRREQRFKRELLLARQVTHKNVVRIHDIGEVGGTKYITMAFIEGETLGARLRRGPIPVPESLGLARQIAAGLAAAHEAGIVHRDLKPENVMVTPDGVAVVMDFGIARLSEPTTMTTTGGIVGTIEYMAPEQAAGRPVDARTDVYAFGLVVYDMVLGRRRLMGRETLSELLSRSSSPPPPPRTLGAAIPDATEALVMRCLQPDPDARYPSAAALVDALAALTPDGRARAGVDGPTPAPPAAAGSRGLSRRALAAAALLAAIAGLGLWTWRLRSAPIATTTRAPVSVLVADFQNAANDPTFDGLVEQALGVGIESSPFITAFPRRDALRAASLLSRSSLDEDTARLVAIREGVQVVVTGRVEAAGGSYRLFARAMTPGTQERVLLEWTTDADGKQDVLPAVGRVAARLRNALGDASADEAHVRVDETFTAGSLDAARAYVEGQELLAQGKLDDALEAYSRAVRLDPDFGRAWSGMGAVLNNRGRRDEAEAAYRQALARTDRMTERERFRTRSSYYVVSGNAQKALEESQALVDRFPADAAGVANLANAYHAQRNFTRAEEVGRAAAAIYPGNVLRQNNVALFALYAGRFDEADAEARKALQINGAYPKAWLGLGLSLLARGRVDEARTAYGSLAKASGGATFAAHGLADLAIYRGRLDEAIAILEPAIKSETSAAARSRLQLVLAEAFLTQGNPAAALRELEAVRKTGGDRAIRFETGRLLLAGGRTAEAQKLAAELRNDVGTEAQALGGVLDAEAALLGGDARMALAALDAARLLADSWLLRYTQGRAFLAAGRHAEADSEFDLCLRRRGEAVSVFLDDVPTWRRMAPLLYYQGLARAGLGSAGAAESFKAFLAVKEGGDESGGLVADARKRLAAN